MGYVAQKHLKWGDEMIAPGESVPDGEEGRDYASLLRSGQIVEVRETEEMSDEELAAEIKRLTEEVEELTASPEVPEDVTPGETRGWPVDEEGQPYKLPEEVRKYISDLETEVAELHADLNEGDGHPDSEAGEEDSGESDENTASQESESKTTTSSADGGLPEGVKPLGGGHYELPDGSKVRGRKALDDALAASSEAGEEDSGD